MKEKFPYLIQIEESSSIYLVIDYEILKQWNCNDQIIMITEQLSHIWYNGYSECGLPISWRITNQCYYKNIKS